jgi:hypothetical protein
VIIAGLAARDTLHRRKQKAPRVRGFSSSCARKLALAVLLTGLLSTLSALLTALPWLLLLLARLRIAALLLLTRLRVLRILILIRIVHDSLHGETPSSKRTDHGDVPAGNRQMLGRTKAAERPHENTTQMELKLRRSLSRDLSRQNRLLGSS